MIIDSIAAESIRTMGKVPLFLSLVAFASVIAVVAALAWLTREPPDAEPCAGAQRDIDAAVLADDNGDQEALVNRAVIVRGKCENNEQE
jgi:hypothetical protein